MPEIQRTEEWVITDESGFKSTAVLNVFEGEEARVTDKITEEFKIPTVGLREVVDYSGARFVWVVPYATMKAALEKAGWALVDPA